jgi:hypothetical protein
MDDKQAGTRSSFTENDLPFAKTPWHGGFRQRLQRLILQMREERHLLSVSMQWALSSLMGMRAL